MSQILWLMATAIHMVENLAGGLYESVGQRLMELVRNGLVASMPDPNTWEPKRARIEISLFPNHPLAPKGCPALVVLDHGSGMTDAGLQRYFNWLGTPLKELRKNANGSFHGASQKGIGRLAALGLNENCLQEDYEVRVKHGYYLLSRTQADGDVRFVPVIPEMAEKQGFEINRFISSTATEMGPLKGLKGSFTAVIVPTPIFKSHQEIYDAIKWFLPREQDKMFSLVIGGKVYGPPPLEGEINVTSQDGRYRARLGAAENEHSDGVWLCDEVTGFRVASCQKLGRLLPDPLWFPDLVGDIFAPGLLRHQNTARSTLNKEFTRKSNKEWQRLMMFLISQVAPMAKKLIERDAISGDAAETLDEVVEMIHSLYGVPEEKEKDKHPNGPTPSTPPQPPHTPGKTGGNRGNKGSGTPYRRYVSIKVRNETFLLYRGQSLDPYVYAEVSANNPKQIIVNVRGGYRALPDGKQARREHCLMQLLSAIGRSKFSMDPRQAMCFTNEVRAEFLKKKA